jgi:hypothetical protein
MTCKIKSAGGGGGLALAPDPHLGGCVLYGPSQNSSSSDRSNILPVKENDHKDFSADRVLLVDGRIDLGPWIGCSEGQWVWIKLARSCPSGGFPLGLPE